jgi:hypothetical protein
MEKGGVSMSESVYDKLRKTMQDNLDQITRDSIKSQGNFTARNNKDIDTMRELFSNMITDRELLFDDFNDLISKKNEVYQSLLTLYFAIIYHTMANKELKKFNMVLELFNIYNSREFLVSLQYFLQELYDASLSLRVPSVAYFQSYFLTKFQYIHNLIYPNKIINFSENSNLSPLITVSKSFISKIQKINPQVGDRYLSPSSVLTCTTNGTWIGATEKTVSLSQTETPMAGDLWFDEDLGRLYEAVTNGTWENATYDVIETLVDDVRFPEYYLLFALYILASSTGDDLNFSRISAYASYLTTNNTNMTRIIFGNAESYIRGIKDYLQSFMYIEDYRRKNDTSYSDLYTKEIYETMGGYNELLDFAGSITNQTIEAIKENGTYNTMMLEMTNIQNLILSLMYEIIDSIEVMDNFIESYSAFLRLPIQLAGNFSTTIFSTLQELDNNLPDNLDFNFKSYISSVAFPIYNWINDIVNSNGPVIFKDNYLLVLLYIGQFLRSSLSGDFQNFRYSNYAIYKILSKGNIKNKTGNIISDYLEDSQGLSLRSKEKALADIYGIKISSNPNNDMISSTLKIIIPELTGIDILSFSKIFKYQPDLDSDWFENPEFSDLNKLIYITVFKSLMRSKKDLNRKLNMIFQTRSGIHESLYIGDNFKDIYVENVIKRVIKKILEKVDETLIENRNLILEYSASVSDTSNIRFVALNNYKKIWQAFYSEDTDLFETMLTDNGELKQFLKTKVV